MPECPANASVNRFRRARWASSRCSPRPGMKKQAGRRQRIIPLDGNNVAARSECLTGELGLGWTPSRQGHLRSESSCAGDIQPRIPSRDGLRCTVVSPSSSTAVSGEGGLASSAPRAAAPTPEAHGRFRRSGFATSNANLPTPRTSTPRLGPHRCRRRMERGARFERDLHDCARSGGWSHGSRVTLRAGLCGDELQPLRDQISHLEKKMTEMGE